MPAWLLTIITKLAGLLIKLGLKKKEESSAQKAAAAEKTIQSVNESLELEKEIRDGKDDKNSIDVTSDDGGISFDDFNSGK